MIAYADFIVLRCLGVQRTGSGFYWNFLYEEKIVSSGICHLSWCQILERKVDIGKQVPLNTATTEERLSSYFSLETTQLLISRLGSTPWSEFRRGPSLCMFSSPPLLRSSSSLPGPPSCASLMSRNVGAGFV